MTSLNVLRVTNLTRQVTAAHLREVFGHFGDVARVDLAVDATVGLSRGYAVVELASRADAEAAKAALDGGRLDGNRLAVRFEGEPAPPPAAAARGRQFASRSRSPPSRSRSASSRSRSSRSRSQSSRHRASGDRRNEHVRRGRRALYIPQ